MPCAPLCLGVCLFNPDTFTTYRTSPSGLTRGRFTWARHPWDRASRAGVALFRPCQNS